MSSIKSVCRQAWFLYPYTSVYVYNMIYIYIQGKHEHVSVICMHVSMSVTAGTLCSCALEENWKAAITA